MSGDMQNWRPLLSTASSKLSSFKGYLTSKDPRPRSPASPYPGGSDPSKSKPGADLGSATRQSWTQWAGEKWRRSNQPRGYSTSVVETVSLFPGWAARRLHQPPSDTCFDADVYVAGFASRLNNPDFMSRSQRAFLRLAKGFASLPKLQDESQASSASEMMEVKEMQDLEERLRKTNNCPDSSSSDLSFAIGTPPSPSPSISSRSSSSSDTQPKEWTSSLMSSVQELHYNLEQRLMPFWSSSLSNRTIRISVYASEPAASIAQALGREADSLGEPRLRPVASRDVTTAQDGSFQIKFGIPWAKLCVHPDCDQIVSGDATTEHDFFVLAELLPPPSSPSTSAVPNLAPANDPPAPSVQIKIPLSYTPVRVISDIDDTVKRANVLAGPRSVFHTVFVRNLVEVIIPGMGDWYTKMWRRGARFHYVSNGPFEVLPILNEFFPLARLPQGSIKLRSYAGRSFFNGILSAPATRKRQGVLDVLNTFPESQFILVGDSGEQDLELYTMIAMQRPREVLAVFIRDARCHTNRVKPQPVEDPTGAAAQIRWRSYPQRLDPNRSLKCFRQVSRGGDATPSPPMTPGPSPLYQNQLQPPSPYNERQTSSDYFSQSGRSSPAFSYNGSDNGSGPSFGNSQIREDSASGTIDTFVWLGPKPASVSDAEWKRSELQMRVDCARVHIPQNVKFRLFTDPAECVEAFEVLDQLKGADPCSTTMAGWTSAGQ